jgi:hypothetical protein
MWLHKRHFVSKGPWNPQKAASQSTPMSGNKLRKRQRWTMLDDKGWYALEEAMRMAEGRHQISLGRMEARSKPGYQEARYFFKIVSIVTFDNPATFK